MNAKRSVTVSVYYKYVYISFHSVFSGKKTFSDTDRFPFQTGVTVKTKPAEQKLQIFPCVSQPYAHIFQLISPCRVTCSSSCGPQEIVTHLRVKSLQLPTKTASLSSHKQLTSINMKNPGACLLNTLLTPRNSKYIFNPCSLILLRASLSSAQHEKY